MPRTLKSMNAIFAIIRRWTIRIVSRAAVAPERLQELPTTTEQRQPNQQGAAIENYRPGYPQFAALVGAHDYFFAFRPFMRLRARLLLLKQDELVVLEAQLDKVDKEEPSPLFLGKRRSDENNVRASLVEKIQACLAEYDQQVERCHRMLGYTRAKDRDVESLKSWVESTACLSREETTYLDKDLVGLHSPNDGAMKQLEDFVEDQLIAYYGGFREKCGNEVSTDAHVYLHRGSLVTVASRGLMLFLITMLLLMPVVLCIAMDDLLVRVCVIILSTVIYLTILARLTQGKMMELILAGATFATILTAFVSNSSG